MDPRAFWLHDGKLFMAKREVVNRGWLSDAHSSKKLKGEWKKASSLGMPLTAKYSGAREPTFADADIFLRTVVFGKREEAGKTISDEKLRLLPIPQVFGFMYNFGVGYSRDLVLLSRAPMQEHVGIDMPAGTIFVVRRGMYGGVARGPSVARGVGTSGGVVARGRVCGPNGLFGAVEDEPRA